MFHLPKLTADRSLEDIGVRAIALSEKGKVVRVFDKTQDLQEVIGLVESLRQAILIYQVSVGHHQTRKTLTLRTGVATTVNIQPGRPFDCEPPLPVAGFETQWSVGRFKSSFDTLLGLHQVR